MTLVNGTMPFDVWINLQLLPDILHNSPELGESAPFFEYLNAYCEGTGLGPTMKYLFNERFEGDNANEIRLLQRFINDWVKNSALINDNPQRLLEFEHEIDRLPELTKPIVLYRIFRGGIYGDQPNVGNDWNQERSRHCRKG